MVALLTMLNFMIAPTQSALNFRVTRELTLANSSRIITFQWNLFTLPEISRAQEYHLTIFPQPINPLPKSITSPVDVIIGGKIQLYDASFRAINCIGDTFITMEIG